MVFLVFPASKYSDAPSLHISADLTFDQEWFRRGRRGAGRDPEQSSNFVTVRHLGQGVYDAYFELGNR